MNIIFSNEFTYFIIFLNFILAFILIYFEHNEPDVTWAWILVIFILPILGFVIYLCVGLDGKRSAVYLQKQQNDKNIWYNIYALDYDGLKFLHMHENKRLVKEYLSISGAKKFSSLIALNYRTNNATLCMNNNIETFFEGNLLFEDIINEINNATSYIHLQSYIIKNDYLSNRIEDALIKASNRGVEIKVLADKIGSFTLDRAKSKQIQKTGIPTSFFLSFTKFSANLRNHRKIIIIDGKTGYIGGFNIGREYISDSKKFGHWRDSHIKIKGDSVKMLEISFIKDWNSSPKSSNIELLEKYFPTIDTDETYKDKVQIVSCGPDTVHRNVELSFVKLINTAKRSIYITTPYFMPSEPLASALKTAILSGVKVTIMFPKNPDHPFVFGASMSHIRQFIDLGASCYAYDNGFIHSKLVVVDESVSSVGSVNFDVRSFRLNFEITAFIYSHNISKQIIRQINQDIKDSIYLTTQFYEDRKRIDKIKEAFSRLFSPLL